MINNDSKPLKHFRQEFDYDCGAAAYQQILFILGISINNATAQKEVKTKKSGTHDYDVVPALKNRIPNKEIGYININQNFEDYKQWLELLSFSNLIYIGGEYRNRFSNRGRDQVRHHAIACFNGFIYDPSETMPFPIEAYNHVCNKRFKIKNLILVDNGGYFYR